MKRKRIRLFGFVFAIILTLTGCGTSLHEMTDEERELVVHYAAYVVAKHNIAQTDGLNSTMPKAKEPEAPAVTESTETSSEADNTGSDKPQDTGQDTGQNTGQPTASTTLPEAIGAVGLEVSYKGCTAEKDYMEGVYFLQPADGKKYAIMKFQISNPTSKDIMVDAVAANPIFYASFNGDKPIRAQTTFLTYSLSTFQGKVKAGEKFDVVLLFEVGEEASGEYNDVTLTQEKDGITYSISL